MTKPKTLDQLEEDYLREHPVEVDAYVVELFEEYNRDGNTGALLASLRVVSRIKGVGAIADSTGLTRKGIQKALSEKGNPRFDSINAILHAMGYNLKPEKIGRVRRAPRVRKNKAGIRRESKITTGGRK